MWLKDYWALFATQIIESKNLTLLQNPNLPILEVNAGYGDDVLFLQAQAKKLQRPALLVSSQALDLVSSQGLELVHTLRQGAILEWQVKNDHSVYVEQVAWTQANALTQCWCEMHKAISWHGLVSIEIARVMQNYPEMCAYLAIEHEQPIGMLLAMPKNGWWHNGSPAEWFSNQPEGAVSAFWAASRPEIASALFERASTDFMRLEVSLPLEKIKTKWAGFNKTDFAVFGFDEHS